MVIRTMPSWQFRWGDSGFDRWWSYGFGWGCDQATLWERRKEEGNGLAEMLIDQFQYIKIQTSQQGLGTLDASGFFVHGFRSWLSLKKVTRRLVGLREAPRPTREKTCGTQGNSSGNKTKEMCYSLLSLKMISFDLFSSREPRCQVWMLIGQTNLVPRVLSCSSAPKKNEREEPGNEVCNLRNYLSMTNQTRYVFEALHQLTKMTFEKLLG